MISRSSSYNPVTKNKGDCIAVGRASVGIYLALKSINASKGKVIVPANICYAAIFPIIKAGFNPVFCDVDKYSGNVTYDIVEKTDINGVIAAIIPHMYGNPVSELKEIYSLLNKNGIVLIEDCASLMTSDGENYMPGTMGDYVVYSTGYSKTIDIGFGGLLYSKKHSLDIAEELERTLPPFRQEFEEECSLFSKLYRTIRNAKHDSNIVKYFYSSLKLSFIDCFVFSIDESKKNQIISSIDKLDSIVEERRTKQKLYNELIKKDSIVVYPLSKKSVPWRFCLFIKDNARIFIDYCLENNLPVSDWYPVISNMFGDDSKYEGAEWHEKHIVNFPLLIDNDRIYEICNIINGYFD